MNETTFAELFRGTGGLKALPTCSNVRTRNSAQETSRPKPRWTPATHTDGCSAGRPRGLVKRGATKAGYRVAQDPALTPLITLFLARRTRLSPTSNDRCPSASSRLARGSAATGPSIGRRSSVTENSVPWASVRWLNAPKRLS